MCKIILFRLIHSRNQITKPCTVRWHSCYYEELEPVELGNTKTSTKFLMIGKHLKMEKVNLSDLTSKFFFSELKVCVANHFPKILISILSICLHHSVLNFIIHHQYSTFLPSSIIRQIKRQIWPPCLFSGNVWTLH